MYFLCVYGATNGTFIISWQLLLLFKNLNLNIVIQGATELLWSLRSEHLISKAAV